MEKKDFFSLISLALSDKEYHGSEIDENAQKELFSFAKQNDIVSIMNCALKKLGINNRDFIKGELVDISRYEKLEYDYKKITEIFSENGVDYVLLKGGVIRKYYPKAHYRTSSDIDILVRENEIERVKKILFDKGYTSPFKNTHDVTFTNDEKCHIEVHYSLANSYEKKARKLFYGVFDKCAKVNGNEYAFTNEYFYAYFIFHLSKHFVHGIGVRPFIDMLLMRDKFNLDGSEKALLEELGLTAFEKYVNEFIDYLFFDKEGNETVKAMENYVLAFSLYGSLRQQVSSSKAQKKKGKYLLERIFMPYDTIVLLYPNAKGKKYLIPYFWVKRWLRVIFRGRVRRGLKEIRLAGKRDNKQTEKTEKLLRELKLL